MTELGRGGTGVVYKAWDSALDRLVALKIQLGGGLEGQTQKQRFLLEAQAVARLEHPSIVAMYDFGVQQGCPYLTMEYVPGQTLRDRLATSGPLPWQEAAQLAAWLARALECAHARGIVHRDVKPGNVLLGQDGLPRLADFGIALIDAGGDTRLTMTGQVLGTPAYMAPEQARADLSTLGPRSDIYSLGALLYHALSGCPPYEGASNLDTLSRLLKEGPRPLNRLMPALPQELLAVCQKAMAREQDERYPSATALAEDLERYLRGEPVQASLPSAARRLKWFVHRNRRNLWAIIATLLIAATLLMGARLVSHQLEARAQALRESVASRQLLHVSQLATERLQSDHGDEALRMLEGFVGLPDIQGTRAVSQAWLEFGDTHLRRGEETGALDAYVRAYMGAHEAEEQLNALLKIGGVLSRRAEGKGLRNLVRTIEGLLPEHRDSPALNALRLEAALRERNLPAAIALTEKSGRQALRPLLEALQTVTVTEQELSDSMPYVRTLPVPRLQLPGQSDTVLLIQDLAVSTRSAELPKVRWPAPPQGFEGFSITSVILPLDGDEGEPWYAISLEDSEGKRPQAGLFRPKDSTFELVTPLPIPAVTSAASADLDGDGKLEYYTALLEQLWCTFRDADGHWKSTVPHRTTVATRSFVKRIFVADLDADGTQELVVAMGPWSAYDLRIFHAGKEPGTLELIGRLKLGRMSDAIPLPVPGSNLQRILALRPNNSENRNAFPEDKPSGEPVGLYLLDWDGVALTTHAHLIPPWDARLQRVMAGDFDGDGLQDFAVRLLSSDKEQALWVGRQLADGTFESVAIPGLYPIVVANVDDDRADELVVRDEASGLLMVLGTQGELLSPLSISSEAPPRNSPGGPFAQSWARIEALKSFGLFQSATEQLRALASVAWGTAEAGPALREAGRISESQGLLREAADLFAKAAERPEVRAEALGELVRVLALLHRPEKEREAIVALLALPDLPEVQKQVLTKRKVELDARLARDAIVVDLGAPLDQAWQLLQPEQIRHFIDDKSLELRAYAGDGPVAALPLTWDGGPLSVEFSLDITRLDGESQLAVCLRAVGAPLETCRIGLSIEGVSQGPQFSRRIRRFATPPEEYFASWTSHIDPGSAGSLRARFELDPSSLHLMAEGDDFFQSRPLSQKAFPKPGQYLLSFEANTNSSADGALAEVRLRSLKVRGARVDRGQQRSDPRLEVDRLLVEGHYPEVLTWVDAHASSASAHVSASEPPREDLERRVLALFYLGRWAEASGLLPRLLNTAATRSGADHTFQELLRRAPGWVFEALPSMSALDRLRHYRPVWAATVDRHLEDPTLTEALIRGLEWMDDLPIPTEAPPTERLAYLKLMVQRASALRLSGQSVAALFSLQRAMHGIDACRGQFTPPEAQLDLAQLMADAHTERARCLVANGRLQEARREVGAALESAPAPETFRDRLLALPELRGFLP